MGSSPKKRVRRGHGAVADPYLHLVADIIVDAIKIAAGKGAVADKWERVEAIRFLRSEKCHRWAGVIGPDWEVLLKHLLAGRGGEGE